jgi:hypothetical protein
MRDLLEDAHGGLSSAGYSGGRTRRREHHCRGYRGGLAVYRSCGRGGGSASEQVPPAALAAAVSAGAAVAIGRVVAQRAGGVGAGGPIRSARSWHRGRGRRCGARRPAAGKAQAGPVPRPRCRTRTRPGACDVRALAQGRLGILDVSPSRCGGQRPSWRTADVTLCIPIGRGLTGHPERATRLGPGWRANMGPKRPSRGDR